MAIPYTKSQVPDIIEQFLDGTGDRWAWDDFTSIQIVDRQLEAIRLRCIDLYDGNVYPGRYCGPDGVSEMRRMVEGLRRET